MPRSSHTGHYQMIPDDSEDQDVMTTSYTDNAAAASQDITSNRNAREPESPARRTLRSIRNKWDQRRHRDATLPTFRPWFTIIVALVNIGLFIAICATDGIASITFTPKQEQGFVEDFMGQEIPAVREKPANFFIGPTATDLIHHGAKYATVSVAHL